MKRGRRSRRYRHIGVLYIPPGIYPMTILRMIAGRRRIVVSNRAESAA